MASAYYNKQISFHHLGLHYHDKSLFGFHYSSIMSDCFAFVIKYCCLGLIRRCTQIQRKNILITNICELFQQTEA